MSWLDAVRLLMRCPALLRVGVQLVTALVDALDRGKQQEAEDLVKVALRGRAAGEAAYRAGKNVGPTRH